MIALAMWRTSFGGVNDFGLGSAIAVFLFLLVIPILAAQHPPLQEGGLMARPPRPRVARRRSSSESRARSDPPLRLGKAPIHILLVVVGLLWLVPDVGLFLTSLFAPSDINSDRLVEDLHRSPACATFDNYQDICRQRVDHARRSGRRSWIAVGGTVLPIIVAALAGYAFAWLEFPGRDWLFLIVIALLVVPLQMALIPMFRLYNKVGIFDTS